MTPEVWTRMVGVPHADAETWRVYRRTGSVRDARGVSRHRWELVRLGDDGVREQEWPVSAFNPDAIRSLAPGVYRIEWRVGRRCVGRGPMWELAARGAQASPATPPAESPGGGLDVVGTIAQQVEAQVAARVAALDAQASRERDFFSAAAAAERGRSEAAAASERARLADDRAAMAEHYRAMAELGAPDTSALEAEIDELRAHSGGGAAPSALDRIVDAVAPGIGALLAGLGDLIGSKLAPAGSETPASEPAPATETEQ